MGTSFEYQKHMFKLMGKKNIALLRIFFLGGGGGGGGFTGPNVSNMIKYIDILRSFYILLGLTSRIRVGFPFQSFQLLIVIFHG